MDNITKALIIIAGLVLTGILIAYALGVFNSAKATGDNTAANMTNQMTQMNESRYTQYDGAILTGEQVRSVINQFESDEIGITVNNKQETRTTVMGYDSTKTGTAKYIKDDMAKADKLAEAEEAARVRKSKDINDASYINPSWSFYGIVNRNADTGAIIGISFFAVK